MNFKEGFEAKIEFRFEVVGSGECFEYDKSELEKIAKKFGFEEAYIEPTNLGYMLRLLGLSSLVV